MEKGYLSLEVGDKILRYVYVAKVKGVYTLTHAGEMAVNLNLSTPGALTQAIRSIVEKEELLPKRIFIAISRKDVLIHQQLMPKMNAAELAQVVPGEIEKIPFFYNQAFEYSYTAFMHSREKDRVLLVAVSQSFLESVINEVDATKLPFRDIEISPLNLKELLPKIDSTDTCQANLVVQEFCSYFFIYKGGSYLGVYRSPIGSQQIKSPANPSNQEIMLSNWVGEFERVVKAHLVEHPQTAIEKLWLIADQASSLQIQNEISRHLDIPTQIPRSEDVQNLNVPDKIQWNSAYMAALTPLMFHFNNKKPLFAFDHFFAKFQTQKHIMLVMMKTIIFLITLSLGAGGVNYIVKQDLAFLHTETKKLSQDIQILNHQTKDLFAQKKEYLDVRNKLLAQAGYVQEINRTSWTHVLAAIATELPVELSLTGFKFSESGDVNINGETFDITNIAELIRKVDQSSILEGGKFEFLREKKQKEVKLFNFGIQANLKGKKVEFNGTK